MPSRALLDFVRRSWRPPFGARWWRWCGGRALPALPAEVLAERSIMMRTMLMYTCAEFERGLAEGKPFPWPDWPAAAHGLIDGIVALMLGPVSRLPRLQPPPQPALGSRRRISSSRNFYRQTELTRQQRHAFDVMR